MEGKGKEIARCLGYRHAFHDNDNMNDLVGDNGSSILESIEPDDDASGSRIGDTTAENGAQDHDVDMWHLRSLAIQPGGLMNSHGRKLGWIKLAGVDGLVFNSREHVVVNSCMGGDGSPQEDDRTYEKIQKHLEQEMEPSKWHIQQERRRLRKSEPKHKQRSENPTHPSSALSHDASSTNGLSSIGSPESGSSTPLTANLNSHAGTPKSVTFDHGLGPPSSAGASFTAFSTKRYVDSYPTSSHTSSYPSITVDTTFDSDTLVVTTVAGHTLDNPSSSNGDVALTPSPLSLSSPVTARPQCKPSSQFQWSLTPRSYLEYSQKYQRKHKRIKPRAKKDRRPQERKLLVQIATSAFYLIQCQQRNESGAKIQYYPGMQDLIAVLLLHLESPSLTSLLLKQIVESHLLMYCSANENDDCHESFISCTDDVTEDGSSYRKDIDGGCDKVNPNWDVLSLSFFPLLQILDRGLHASLLEIHEGCDFIKKEVLVFGEVLDNWMSSWFCCHDTLPLEVISRLVDFFLASHPSMPLYLSMAIMCHPIHRDKFLLLSRRSPKSSPEPQMSSHPLHEESKLPPPQSSPHNMNNSLATILDNLFVNLRQELTQEGFEEDGDIDEFGTYVSMDDATEWEHNDSNKLVIDFIEQAISTATSFMKQIPPQEIFSLAKEYRNGILVSYLSPQERERATSPLPWTNRSTAPTDYNMIQRIFADKKVDAMNRFTLSRSVAEKHQIALDASGLPASQLMMAEAINRFTLSRSVAEKHQIALDASGLPMSQLMIKSRTREHWSSLTSRKMSPTKAVIIGIALCVGAQLLQLKYNPFDRKMILSEENYPLLGLAFVEETPVIETASGSNLSPDSDLAPSHVNVISSFTSEDNQEKISDKLSHGDSTFPNVSSDTDTKALHEIPTITAEDTIDDNLGVIKTTTNIGWPHRVQSSSEERHVSETLSGADSEDVPSPLEQDEGLGFRFFYVCEESFNTSEPGECHHLLGHNTKKKGVKKQPGASIPRRIKRYTARRRKLSAGIKKRAVRSLEGFRDGYIALVENDDFFL
mmetsp:Transcript_40168/g.70671  ORF Transcript_40168/g.70671 Transcript_40168/m.70671 type:complete len:1044 (-) Transcript_40168:192-3323(-)